MTNGITGEPPTPPPLALPTNFAWILLGSGGYAVSQWAVLIFLARLGTPQMVGEFALGLAVATPIVLLCKLSLRAVIATDASDEYPFGTYLGLRLITTLAALAMICVVIITVGYRLEVAMLMLVIGLAKGFEGVSELTYGLLQRHERMSHVGISLLGRGLLSLALATTALWATGNVVVMAAGMAAGWLVWLFAYDLGKARMFAPTRPVFPRRELWSLTRLALPLGVVALLLSLAGNIPRYFIERSYGEAELGIFAALAYLMVVGTTAIGAMGQSAGPRLARLFVSGALPAFSSLLRRLVLAAAGLGLTGVLVAFVLGRQIIEAVYGPLYADRHELLMWLMVVAMVGYVASILGYAMTAQRRLKEQVWLFAGVVLAQMVSCAILVPLGGSEGAARSLLIATLLQLVGAALICRAALRRAAKPSALESVSSASARIS
jgi:O-antigen/teichoic acid export membrane protein